MKENPELAQQYHLTAVMKSREERAVVAEKEKENEDLLKKKNEYVWYEAKNDDGISYYWHIHSGGKSYYKTRILSLNFFLLFNLFFFFKQKFTFDRVNHESI